MLSGIDNGWIMDEHITEFYSYDMWTHSVSMINKGGGLQIQTVYSNICAVTDM